MELKKTFAKQQDVIPSSCHISGSEISVYIYLIGLNYERRFRIITAQSDDIILTSGVINCSGPGHRLLMRINLNPSMDNKCWVKYDVRLVIYQQTSTAARLKFVNR